MSRFGSSSENTSSITFNQSNSKYTVTIPKNIETTVTNDARVVDSWIQEINSLHAMKPTVVGLNLKCCSHWSDYPIISFTLNASATLQLCIDEKCLIVQLFFFDIFPPSLKNFFMNPNFTFVGIHVADDIAKLKNEYGIHCHNRADIAVVAKKKLPRRSFSTSCWGQEPSLKELAWEVVGLRIEEPQPVSKISRVIRNLSNEEIEYCCIDAYASYKIGHKLLRDS